MEGQVTTAKRIVVQHPQKLDADDRFITVRRAAELIKLSEPSIRRFLTQQRLKRYKVGSRTLLDRKQVLSLVREA